MKKIIIISLSLVVAAGVLFYFKFYNNCCEGGSCVHQNAVTPNSISEKDTATVEMKKDSLMSVITCPKCGYKKSGPMPTAV